MAPGRHYASHESTAFSLPLVETLFQWCSFGIIVPIILEVTNALHVSNRQVCTP